MLRLALHLANRVTGLLNTSEWCQKLTQVVRTQNQKVERRKETQAIHSPPQQLTIATQEGSNSEAAVVQSQDCTGDSILCIPKGKLHAKY